WITAVQPTYYTIKMTYLGWALAVIAVAAALATVRARARPGNVAAVRAPLARAAQLAAVSVLVICALVMELLLTGLDQVDTSSNWLQVVSKQAWITAHADSLERRYGSLAIRTSEYLQRTGGVVIVVPCSANLGQAVSRWAMYLTGGMNEVEWNVLYATCSANTEAELGNLPAFLRAHPDVVVSVLAMTDEAYTKALALQRDLSLPNLVVVSPTSQAVG
ncbi:MAG: hypothetical protein WCI74_07870, partial [Actinomycetes bacterium]